MYFNKGESIIHHILKADNQKTSAIVLSALTSMTPLTSHADNHGYNIIQYAIANGYGQSVLKSILDEFDKAKLIQILQQTTRITDGLGDYDSRCSDDESIDDDYSQYTDDERQLEPAVNCFDLAYKQMDEKCIEILCAYLSDELKDILWHAACKYDKKCAIFEAMSSKELKTALHSIDKNGYTLLRTACESSGTKVAEWLIEKAEVDDILLTKPDDLSNRSPIAHVCNDYEYEKVIAAGIKKISND